MSPEEVYERLRNASEFFIAMGGQIGHHYSLSYRYGRWEPNWTIVGWGVGLCLCPISALLFAEQPIPRSLFEHPLNAAADLLGTTDRELASFVRGYDGVHESPGPYQAAGERLAAHLAPVQNWTRT